jgi:hypothetical protein
MNLSLNFDVNIRSVWLYSPKTHYRQMCEGGLKAHSRTRNYKQVRLADK